MKIFVCFCLMGFFSLQSFEDYSCAFVERHSCDTLVVDNWTLADTSYLSTKIIDYVVDTVCRDVSGRINQTDDLYDGRSVLTFRGSAKRDMPQVGSLSVTPSDISVEWRFKTKYDTVNTAYGRWGGGSGWTGQPLYVEWSDSLMQLHRKYSKSLLPAYSNREVIIGSLCGWVHFINYETGEPSRIPFDCANPIKGTVSLDPAGRYLYVGQGVPRSQPFGMTAFDLLYHKKARFFGKDTDAYRAWGACDSSPIVVDGFLIWPSENGSIYKFMRTQNGPEKHSILRYRVKGKTSLGVESSLAVYHNYAYFGDNSGSVICINLNNMKPVWYYDNTDDIDASIVIEQENGMPYVYVGCEIDKQGAVGVSKLSKINGLDGTLEWQTSVPCNKVKLGTKTFDGGMFATPLLGGGDCQDLVISNFAQTGNSKKGELIAFSKNSGEVKYRVLLKGYSWSSPVALYNKENEMFIFTGDVLGNVYILRGKTGEILVQKLIGLNFESSPVVVDSTIVIGSRGREIIKLLIK